VEKNCKKSYKFVDKDKNKVYNIWEKEMLMWGNIAITFIIAFVTSYVFTPYTVRLARKVKALDKPKDKRKVHKKIMPRLGGIAIVIGFLVSATYLIITMIIEKKLDILAENYYIKLIGFFVAIIILEIFCFMDDKKGIRPIVKLLGQLLAAIIVVASGNVIENITIFSDTIILGKIVLKVITVIWIIGITNAINLLDGLDGLSTGVSLISSICLMFIFILNSSPYISIILATALAGSLLGFLPFNFNPARTFMGDTGSNFIGFTLAVTSIMGVAKTYTAIIIIAPLLVLALPIFDTSFAIIRRVIKEKSLKAVFKADRGHLHHKLIDKGYTQKQAVFILYGISTAFGVFAIILFESGIWKAISFALLILAIGAMGYKDIFKVKKKKE